MNREHAVYKIQKLQYSGWAILTNHVWDHGQLMVFICVIYIDLKLHFSHMIFIIACDSFFIFYFLSILSNNSISIKNIVL
jgi:hypothetical protein